MIGQGPMAAQGQMPMQQAAAPVPQLQNNPGAMDLMKKYAMNKAVTAGIGMMPGGPLAQGAMTAALPAFGFNKGGMAPPLGGGQTKQGLMEARKLGALTQEEFLKAMAHGGHLNWGGKVSGVKYKRNGGEIQDEAHVTFHGPLSPKGE